MHRPLSFSRRTFGALALGGTITQNGGLLPITTPAYENGVLWARARDTGALHRLKLVNWRTGGGSYPETGTADVSADGTTADRSLVVR